MRLRRADAGDTDALRDLLLRCFPGAEEAETADRMRADGDVSLAVLAEIEGAPAAFALFARMRAPARALALGPVCTAPAWRSRGLMGRLVAAGLAAAAAEGWTRAFVLGRPAHWARFGFDADEAAGFAGPLAGPFLLATRLGHVPAPGPGAACVYPRAYDALLGR